MTFKVVQYNTLYIHARAAGVSDDSFGVRDAAPDVPTTSSPSPRGAGVKPRPVFQARTPPMGIINRRAASLRPQRWRRRRRNIIYYIIYIYTHAHTGYRCRASCLNKPDLMISTIASPVQECPRIARAPIRGGLGGNDYTTQFCILL